VICVMGCCYVGAIRCCVAIVGVGVAESGLYCCCCWCFILCLIRFFCFSV